MLPPGLAAQPADRADHERMRALLPTARTTVRLLVGGCSCDLVRPRHADPLHDERHHRDRFRRAGGSREALIGALERHRRGAQLPAPAAGWPRALAGFVSEHARNAGETVYLLRFTTPADAAATLQPARRVRVAEVVAQPERWIEEHVPVVVGR